MAALSATLPAGKLADRYVLEKPLGRISDPLRFHGGSEAALRSEIADRLDAVYRAVSPLDRVPTVGSRHIAVVGGEFDQVARLAAACNFATHFHASLIRAGASHLFDLHRSQRLVQILSENPDLTQSHSQ